MFFNDKEIQEKSYEELLDICRIERKEKVDEFIRELEEDIKKEMSKGDSEAKRICNKICMQEKDIVLNYFTQLGFVIEFQELVTEKIPVYWFNVSWKHLL